MPFRPWQKVRNATQAVLYKLGPTYCILLGSTVLLGSFVIQLIVSIGVPYIMFDFYRFDLSNYSFVILGMWAACTGQQAITFPTRPDLNQPERFTCPPASWGWKTLRFSGITDNFFHHTLPKAVSLIKGEEGEIRKARCSHTPSINPLPSVSLINSSSCIQSPASSPSSP